MTAPTVLPSKVQAQLRLELTMQVRLRIGTRDDTEVCSIDVHQWVVR